MLRPPRQHRDRVGLGMKPDILAVITAEAVDVGSVDPDPFLKRSGQLAALDRDILLNAVNIAEGKTNEFDVLFFDLLHQFLFRMIHIIALLVLEILTK